MRILFTGATGVIGRRALPLLVADGHQVVAVVRDGDGADEVENIGAQPVELDLFDPAAVAATVGAVDGVVHFATSIPPQRRMTRRSAWRTNDRLRAEATGLLVDAAIRHRLAVFVQQSVSLVYADGGSEWLPESATVAPVWDVLDSALAAEEHVARFTSSGGGGVTLRLARLYGPGRVSSEFIEAVARRKLPVVGRGNNYVSSLHVDDAARAVRLALTAPPGVYNVADDEPVTAAEVSGSLAELLGATPPRRLPAGPMRVALGRAVGLLTVSHRVANRRFREQTGWVPAHRSVVDGWADVLEEAPA